MLFGNILSTEDWAAWRAQFQAYLAEHGQVTYDLDFANPVPAEQPAALLEALKMYLQGGGDPYARHQTILEHRTQATAAILALLHWLLNAAPGREDSLADLGLGHPLIRINIFVGNALFSQEFLGALTIRAPDSAVNGDCGWRKFSSLMENLLNP